MVVVKKHKADFQLKMMKTLNSWILSQKTSSANRIAGWSLSQPHSQRLTKAQNPLSHVLIPRSSSNSASITAWRYWRSSDHQKVARYLATTLATKKAPSTTSTIWWNENKASSRTPTCWRTSQQALKEPLIAILQKRRASTKSQCQWEHLISTRTPITLATIWLKKALRWNTHMRNRTANKITSLLATR